MSEEQSYGGAKKPTKRATKRDTLMRTVTSVGDELSDIFGRMTVGSKKKALRKVTHLHPREPTMRERKTPSRYIESSFQSPEKKTATKKSPTNTMSKMRLRYPKYSDDQINALIVAGTNSQARQQVHKLIAKQNKDAKDLASQLESFRF